MSLNFRQFNQLVMEPILRSIPMIPYSVVAHRLVGETIWHESDLLRAIGQYPRGWITPSSAVGPGLGVCSMELPTFVWLSNEHRYKLPSEFWFKPYKELAWDLRFNVAMCRLRYYVNREPLPSLESGIPGRADYWSRIYQGTNNPAKEEQYVQNAWKIRELWDEEVVHE